MSYILQDKSYNSIDVSKLQLENDGFISIINNSTITFDISSCKIRSQYLTDRVLDVYKASINFGDGQSTTLSAPFKVKTGTITETTPRQWTVFDHTFSFDKEYIYDENLTIKNYQKITITLYAINGESVTYVIPFKVVYKSMYETGTDFEIASANITQNNNVSYVLTKRSDQSNILVNTKDWRVIYADTKKELVRNPPISNERFNNIVLDDDTSTWQWKTVPYMNWEIEPFIREDGSIYFSWKQGGVKFDKATLTYALLDEFDDNAMRIDITNLESYTIYDDFKDNVILLQFDIEGANGVNSNTETFQFRGNDCNLGAVRIDSISEQSSHVENLYDQIKFSISYENAEYISNKDLVLTMKYMEQESRYREIEDGQEEEYFVDVEKQIQYFVPFGQTSFVLYKKHMKNADYHFISLEYFLKGSDSSQISEYQSPDDSDILLTVDWQASFIFNDDKCGIDDNQVVVNGTVSPEGPYRLTYTITVSNPVSGVNIVEYPTDISLIYDTVNGINYPRDTYDLRFDGTLLPDGHITVVADGLLADPTVYPDGGRSFSSTYELDWRYPEQTAELFVFRTYLLQSNRDSGQYTFSPKTIFYVKDKSSNADQLALTVESEIIKTSFIYVNGEKQPVYEKTYKTTTHDFKQSNVLQLSDFNQVRFTQTVGDSRDTIYKRSNTSEWIELDSLHTPSGGSTDESIDYSFDPLFDRNFSSAVEFTELIKTRNDEGEISQIGGRSIYYNAVKDDTIHKIVAKTKGTVELNGNIYTVLCYPDTNGIRFLEKTFICEWNNKTYIRYELSADPNVYLSEISDVTTLDNQTDEQVATLIVDYNTIEVGSSRVNQSGTLKVSLRESIGSNPCERTVVLTNDFDQSRRVFNIDSYQVDIPNVPVGQSHTLSILVCDRDKCGDITESWKIELQPQADASITLINRNLVTANDPVDEQEDKDETEESSD